MHFKISKRITLCLLLTLFLIIASASFFNISNFSAIAAEEGNTVYLGGFPVGIASYSDNFIVSEIINVTTTEGSFSPALKAGLSKGDIILFVNGEKITDINTFNDIVSSSEKVVVTVRRGDTVSDYTIVPVLDVTQNRKKLGLQIKNVLSGIGTMTFIGKNGRYAALGHMISDEFGNNSIYNKGNIFSCEIIGFKVADEEGPGALRGNVDFKSVIGEIDVNSFKGLYGKYLGNTEGLEEIEVGKATDVKPGKAYIYTTISGKTPKYYEIDIVKTFKQDVPAEKSMVIRVVDKELKQETGGILQGMSGSPIVQDGKLVGAVTHVFNSDSTKGYGIYAEWMTY